MSHVTAATSNEQPAVRGRHEPGHGGHRNFTHFGLGTPVLWVAFEDSIFMLCANGGNYHVVRLHADAITGEARPERFGRGPDFSDLVGPMIANAYGLFLPCRRAVWFLRMPDGDSGTPMGLERWSTDEGVEIRGATEGPGGEIWLLGVGPGKLAALYRGNGQAPEWHRVITLDLYLREGEGAELLAIRDASGAPLIGVAAGRRLVRFEARSNALVATAQPNMIAIPLLLRDRALAGCFVTTAAISHDRADAAIPLLTAAQGSDGWGIVELKSDAFLLHEVSANHRPIATGPGPHGSVCAVYADRVAQHDANGAVRRSFVETRSEPFAAPAANTAIGNAGAKIIVIVKPQTENIACAYILTPDVLADRLSLHDRILLSADQPRSTIRPTLYPVSAAATFFILFDQVTSCQILYAPFDDAGAVQ